MSDLAFTASDRHYNALVRAVDDAVHVLGPSVAAGAVNMRDGDLRAAIDGRNGRRLDARVAAVIAERVGAGISSIGRVLRGESRADIGEAGAEIVDDERSRP